MISIAEAISDLLFVRDTVVVPGLGAFVKKPTSAKVNPVANHFAMPGSSIEFDPNLREDNELVVNYMAEQNDIPKDEARKLLAMFVSDCFNSLKGGKKLPLKNIGVLYYDWANDLVFDQDKEVNYNADSFGLCDFTPEAVLRSKTKDEIKVEIEKQQKDKNTPVTVDEKAVHRKDGDDDDGPRRLWWLWVVLSLGLVAAVVYGLHYIKVIDLGKWFGRQPRQIVVEPQNYTLPQYAVDWERMVEEAEAKWQKAQEQTQVEEVQEQVQEVQEQVQEPEKEPSVVGQPVIEQPESNIRIIAGCFGQEENAARLANTLKAEGFGGAFYELSGSKWFVSFGRYATDEEATAALREIRANTEYKAWIKK